MNKNKFNLSIKIRFSIYFCIFLSFFLAIFGMIAYYLYLNTNTNNSKNILQIEFLNIKNSINYIGFTQKGLELEDSAIDNIEKATNKGLLFFIFDKSGGTLESPSSIDLLIPKGKEGYFETNIKGDDYLFYAGKVKELNIYIGINKTLHKNNETSLLYILLILWLIVSIVSFFVGYLISSKALKPIKDLINDVKKIDTNKIKNQRIKENYTNDEIGILAETFDEFVEKISNVLRQEKEFTQDISHELRTPLMVIKTSIELINSRELSQYQAEKIRMIENSILKIENLINELLFLARNFNEIPKEKINIKLFLKDFVESYKLLALNKNLFFELEIKSEFEVYTNKTFLEKVLGNLIKNSIFYTEKGGVKIIVEDKKITISDTGVGIKKEDIENIWNRFYRIKQDKIEGVGLGLSIVRNIVIQEKWKINLSSDFGSGTSFEILF